MESVTVKKRLEILERRLDLIILMLRNISERISCVKEVKELDEERLKRQREYG